MERHGFVSFWLWSGAIGSGIFSIIYFFSSGNLLECIIYLISCVAHVLLLKWKLSGFYIYCASCLFGIFLSTDIIGFAIIVTIIAILIEFGILKIKKNGISTWDYLTGKNGNIQNISNYTNKRCRQCNTIYSGYICTNCGSSLYEDITTKDDSNKEEMS